MLEPRRSRSRWIGYGFLMLALIVATGTSLLIYSGHGLADLNSPLGQNSSGEELNDSSGATATAESDAAPTVTPEIIDPEIELSASAALVLDVETDTLLFERNADEHRQPASTAKIVTALTVLAHTSPNEVIEITGEDVVDPAVESSMGLQAGDRVTIYDLLVGLLLPSGNDAANALSRTIGERLPDDYGDDPGQRFISAMHEVTAELEMHETVLLHAAGHDRDGQHVSAFDMAAAARALLERPTLAPIVAMPRAEVRVGGPNERVLQIDNTNELLSYDGVHGIKTGTTVEAGQALVLAYRNGEHEYLLVLLGSSDRYGDARALLGLPEPPGPTDEEDENDAPDG